jgi:uncharacterized protein YmfQ (DUF2313 family)
MRIRELLLTAAVGSAIIAPNISLAATTENTRDRSDRSAYSDRDRSAASKDEKDQLQQSLTTGESKTFYRQQLEKLGWRITSVNYDKPDYVEYEIVKGKSTYEVQIDLDKNSHKATKVDVAWNAWKTDATEAALEGKSVNASNRTTATTPNRYSERDRMKTAKNNAEKLEQSLKTGEEKAFYRQQLDKMGWRITSVNYDKPDYLEYEIVKGDETYEVQIDLDKNSHKSTKVDVTTNVWQADATKNALKQNHASR